MEQIPHEIDLYEVKEKMKAEGDINSNPLKVVLIQEIQRYNLLLELVRNQLVNLDKGI